MPNTCYSWNEEHFYSDMETPLERAVESFLEDNNDFVGETEIQIFEAEKQGFTISRFLPPIAEYLQDRAYGENEDFSDKWCYKIKKNSQQIQEIVASALESWANQTNNQPTFFGVKNIKPYFVKIKIDKEGLWDIYEDK